MMIDTLREMEREKERIDLYGYKHLVFSILGYEIINNNNNNNGC
ncbi:MAG TPA: hypothetical protein VF222_03490 [Nitrososphaeraceae archaeon]